MIFCIQCALEAFVSSDGQNMNGGMIDSDNVYDHLNSVHADLLATQNRRAVLERLADEIVKKRLARPPIDTIDDLRRG
jgi:hypothetical protein